MPLFDWQASRDSSIVSEHFWIYWAVTIPLTVVVIAIWFVWITRKMGRHAREDYVAGISGPSRQDGQANDTSLDDDTRQFWLNSFAVGKRPKKDKEKGKDGKGHGKTRTVSFRLRIASQQQERMKFDDAAAVIYPRILHVVDFMEFACPIGLYRLWPAPQNSTWLIGISLIHWSQSRSHHESLTSSTVYTHVSARLPSNLGDLRLGTAMGGIRPVDLANWDFLAATFDEYC